jgi:hypothetical protein
MKIEQYLLRLYPHTWRERYEDEMLAMLEQRSLSFTDGVNLLFGALDARLHPHLGTTGMSLYERMIQMIKMLRNSLMLIFCAYAVFCVAGVGFQKMTEYNDFTDAARTYSLIGLSFNLVVIGSVIALLAVLVGSLPIAVSLIRSALARKRYGILFFLAAPLLAFLIFLGTTFLLEALSQPDNAHTLAGQILLHRGLFLGVFFAAILVSIGSLCLSILRSEIPEKLLRFAILPSLLATIAMALMLAADITWGLSLRSNVPQLFNGNDGVFGSSTALSWLRDVIIMAIATTLAILALIRGFSARSALRSASA